MAIQQLGPAPSNSADTATKAYVDSAIAGVGGASYKTIAATTAGQWVRFARVTVSSVGGGVSSDITLLGVPDSNNTVDYVDLKLRVGQRAAFGNAPAADVVLMRASTVTAPNMGYVVVQNTPTTIVDFYVQLLIVGRQYQIEYDTPAVTGTASISWFNQDAASTPTLTANASYSTDQVWNSAQKAMFSLAPPTAGWYDAPAGSIGSDSTPGALTSQRQTFTPFIIGPSTVTYDAFVQRLKVAQSGGTVVYLNALYGSDANGMPDTTTTLASATTPSLATVGNLIIPFAAAVTLAPGIYWVSTLYYASTAPTTPPTFTPINNSTWALPIPAGTNVNQNVRGYYISGRTTLMTAALTWSSVIADAGTDIPYTMLRRSA